MPRPETELLAGWVIEHVATLTDPVVVELCAGSGAISLSIVDEAPHARVHAVELDPPAFEWAQRNLAGTGVDLRLGDMADAFADLDGTVDVVVANPPYIPLGRLGDRSSRRRAITIRRWRCGPARTGSMPCASSSRSRWRLLKPGGVVGAEHADAQGESAPAVFARRWSDVRDHRDLADRPRFVDRRSPRPLESRDMGGELALIGTAIAVGLGAAFLPVFVNAEVYVVAIGATVDSKLFLAC